MNFPVRIHLTMAQTQSGQWGVKVTDEDGGDWGTTSSAHLELALSDASPIIVAAVHDVREAAA